MKRFSKKAPFEEAICPSCGNWKPTDFTPEQLQNMDWECADCEAKRSRGEVPQEHGSKEVSVYDKEYDFLKRLALLVSKAAPESIPEIKALSQSHPFKTIDDVGDLAAQIWTLATTKYNIPREWLIKKLPEKKGSLKTADLWPAQEAAEDMLSHNHNSLSYNPLQEPDTSACGPRPDDVEKEASPDTDHELYLSMGQDVINEYFFGKNIRWSQVVSFLKEQVPQLTDEDIATLHTDTKQKLSQFGQQIQAKKAGKEVHCPNCKRLREYADVIQDGKCDQCNKEGVFSGAEFSTTEFNVNPTLDNGPFSSPQDQGVDDQEQPFPNTNWIPADDENQDEQPWSNIAASRDDGHGQCARSEAKYRVKLFDGRGVQYFPDEESANKYYEVALKEDKDPSKPEAFVYKKAHCGPCSVIKAEVIKMLADLKYKDESVTAEDLEEMGKLSADPSNNSFIQELGKIIERLPKEHDKEITKLNNHKLALEDIQKDIDNGDMVADKPFSKKDAMLKKADISGQIVNQILTGIQTKGNVAYNLATGSFMEDNDSMTMLPDRVKVVEGVVDYDEVENFIQSNMDLLGDPNNVLRVLTTNGTVYLGVANMNEVRAFSKKNLVKKGEESPLTKEDQNEIAAKWCPAMNVALNNYAQAIKNGHDSIRALKYALTSVINIGKVKELDLQEAINIYLKGLV